MYSKGNSTKRNIIKNISFSFYLIFILLYLLSFSKFSYRNRKSLETCMPFLGYTTCQYFNPSGKFT